MWACLKVLGPELYDRMTTRLSLKTRMLKDEVMEGLLYVCVTWTPRGEHFVELRKAHLQVPCESLTSNVDFILTMPLSRT